MNTQALGREEITSMADGDLAELCSQGLVYEKRSMRSIQHVPTEFGYRMLGHLCAAYDELDRSTR
jgi:hypothetical protein